MRLSRLLLVCFLLSTTFSFAQPAPAAKPAQAAKAALGFSVDNIDKTMNPCVDFYQYACGNWLKNTEIPADQTEWVSFTELYERNLVTERDILQKASVNDASRSPVEQKIGDYYSSCMDDRAVDAKGLDPLKPELARIAAVKDKNALIDAIARVHLMGPN